MWPAHFTKFTATTTEFRVRRTCSLDEGVLSRRATLASPIASKAAGPRGPSARGGCHCAFPPAGFVGPIVHMHRWDVSAEKLHPFRRLPRPSRGPPRRTTRTTSRLSPRPIAEPRRPHIHGGGAPILADRELEVPAPCALAPPLPGLAERLDLLRARMALPSIGGPLASALAQDGQPAGAVVLRRLCAGGASARAIGSAQAAAHRRRCRRRAKPLGAYLEEFVARCPCAWRSPSAAWVSKPRCARRHQWQCLASKPCSSRRALEPADGLLEVPPGAQHPDDGDRPNPARGILLRGGHTCAAPPQAGSRRPGDRLVGGGEVASLLRGTQRKSWTANRGGSSRPMPRGPRASETIWCGRGARSGRRGRHAGLAP